MANFEHNRAYSFIDCTTGKLSARALWNAYSAHAWPVHGAYIRPLEGPQSSWNLYLAVIMPSYKLIYFNGKGRGEVARFIFAQAGVEYEDYRVPGEEEWKVLKPTLLTGVLPLLEVDGNQLTGSGPINRYLANGFGIGGKTNIEKAKIEAIVDVVDDLYLKILATYVGDDTSQETAKKALEGHINNYFGILEKIISTNDLSKVWACGKQLTYADLSIAANAEPIFKSDPSIANAFPKLKKCVEAVTTLPRIASYLKNRPDSFF